MNLSVLIRCSQLIEEVLSEVSTKRDPLLLVSRFPLPEGVKMTEGADAIQGEEAGGKVRHCVL